MPFVFVVGGCLPNGGARMAYSIGHLIAKHFDHEMVIATVCGERLEDSLFEYPASHPHATLEDCVRRASASDIVIVNPSFSDLMLGLGMKGRKICYVQGFNTFQVLDGFFDLYVSASEFLRRFLVDVYNLRTSVVHPFVDCVAESKAWFDRRDELLVYLKTSPRSQLVLEHILGLTEQAGVDLRDKLTLLPSGITHKEFLGKLSLHKRFMTLSPCEGFGLVPLEAMRYGLAVTGFDGVGGRDYMVDGENCAVTTYPDCTGLRDRLLRIVRDESYAEHLGARAKETSSEFTYSRFSQRWLDILTNFV